MLWGSYIVLVFSRNCHLRRESPSCNNKTPQPLNNTYPLPVRSGSMMGMFTASEICLGSFGQGVRKKTSGESLSHWWRVGGSHRCHAAQGNVDQSREGHQTLVAKVLIFMTVRRVLLSESNNRTNASW